MFFGRGHATRVRNTTLQVYQPSVGTRLRLRRRPRVDRSHSWKCPAYGRGIGLSNDRSPTWLQRRISRLLPTRERRSRLSMRSGAKPAACNCHRRCEDVMSDEDFAPCLAIAERAGFRSVQSTPIVSSSGVVLGVLSTHFPVPHQPNEGEMDALRSLASLAANAIIRMRARLETIKHSRALLDQSSLGWQPVSCAPFDRVLELAVINYVGTHALVFPCRRVLGGWISAETRARIDFHPTHWREWA